MLPFQGTHWQSSCPMLFINVTVWTLLLLSPFSFLLVKYLNKTKNSSWKKKVMEWSESYFWRPTYRPELTWGPKEVGYHIATFHTE
jgi:hypothetical protein